jgi:hypothetical protein
MRLARMAPLTRRVLAVALAFSLVQVPVALATPPDDQLEPASSRPRAASSMRPW